MMRRDSTLRWSDEPRTGGRAKKLSLFVLGFLLGLVALVVFGPGLFDWNRFKPRIESAVAGATGWELSIGGDIDLDLLPVLEFSAEDLSLRNPRGFPDPLLAAVESAHVRVEVWPLLAGKLVLEALRVEGLALSLQVNAAGEPNWLPRSAPDTSARPEDASDDGQSFPLRGVRIGDVRVTDASVHYRDALNDQTVAGREVVLGLAQPRMNEPIELDARLVLNDKPVMLSATVPPLEAVLARQPSRLRVSLETEHLSAGLDAGVQLDPLLGLDGVASLDIESMGALATWLDRPMEVNPGPLAIKARFASDGPRVALEEASVTGDYLEVRASASIDVGGDLVRIKARVESEKLDLDRYRATRAGAVSSRPGKTPTLVSTQGYLDHIPDTPLDLGGLKQLVADVNVAVDGIRIGGYEAGPIRFQAKADGGVLTSDLAESGLYGGSVQGSLRIDGAADRLDAQAKLEVANVNVGELARVAAPEAPPVKGVASGRLDATTGGVSARELVSSLIGGLSLELASRGGKGTEGQLSQLSFTLQRPSLDARLSVKGSAEYGGEPIEFALDSDPLGVVLARDPVDVDARIASSPASASYRGRVYQTPVVSFDGIFDAKVPSVARLGRWLGRPLPDGQPDPGSVEAHAVFRSDGSRGEIREARFTAGGMSLDATGNFETTPDVVQVNVSVRGGKLDLDALLPAKADPKAQDPVDGTSLLDSLSDAPLELAVLNEYTGTFDVSLDGLKVSGIETGPLGLRAALEDRVFTVRLDELKSGYGTLDATARLDGSGTLPRADARLRVDDISIGPLGDALVVLDSGATATLELSASGKSLRRLATGATGHLSLDLPGVVLEQGPFSKLTGLLARVELGGLEARPRVRAAARLEARAVKEPYPSELEGQLGTIAGLLEGKELPLDFTVKVGENQLTLGGRLAALDATPIPEVNVRLTGRRLSELGLDTSGKLADVGPVSLGAYVAAADGTYRISALDARLGASDLSGELAIDLTGERPRLTGDLESTLVDLEELIPYQYEEAAAAPAPADTSERVIPDDPLPTDALKVVDGDLSIRIADLRTDIGSAVENVEARIRLEDGRLDVEPLKGGVAGGEVSIRLLLDASVQPARTEFRMQQTNMRLGTLIAMLKSSDENAGRGDVDLRLSGIGDSPRAIAAGLQGHMYLVAEGGEVDSRLLGTAATGIVDMLAPFLREQEDTTRLNCIAAGLDVNDGLITGRTLLVDMPTLSIVGSGTVNLKDETLDMRFATRARNVSLASLAAPFNVTGTLARPRVNADRAGTALRAAGLLNPAVALGALAAVGVSRSAGENPCVAAMKQAQAQPGGEAAPEAAEVTAEPEAEPDRGEGRRLGRRLRGLFGGG